MNTNQTVIQKRQHFYWLGRKREDENDIPKAIEAYKEYSTHLAEGDKHIPHQWISKFYDKLENPEKSLIHLEEFAKGCTPPKAAEVFKEIGEKYLELNSIEKAVINFENAIENNPNIGIKKKLDELKNSLL
jgi:tetratricopeptide (TPR) repeat protein